MAVARRYQSSDSLMLSFATIFCTALNRLPKLHAPWNVQDKLSWGHATLQATGKQAIRSCFPERLQICRPRQQLQTSRTEVAWSPPITDLFDTWAANRIDQSYVPISNIRRTDYIGTYQCCTMSPEYRNTVEKRIVERSQTEHTKSTADHHGALLPLIACHHTWLCTVEPQSHRIATYIEYVGFR